MNVDATVGLIEPVKMVQSQQSPRVLRTSLDSFNISHNQSIDMQSTYMPDIKKNTSFHPFQS